MAEQAKLPPPGSAPEAAEELPIISHLLELRDRVLRIVLTIMAIFLCLFWFANDLYTLLAKPLLVHLPAGTTMIATEVASPFLTPFKLTLILSIFLAIPVVLYHLWAFVAPGLYKDERRLVYPLLISSSLLFFAGAAFAYFVVFPLVFGFFTSVIPDGVSMMTDITKYLDFVLGMFFAFGIAFEVPVAVILLVWTGAVTPQSLSAKRRYVIVMAFVLGMVLTPPDVISQILLAIPLWILFEAGVWLSRFYVRPALPEEAVEQPQAPTVTETPAAQRTYNTPKGTQPTINAPYSIGVGKPRAADSDTASGH